MKQTSDIIRQERATVIPEMPINGLYPTLTGIIYTEEGYNGLTEDHFVADDGQGLDEYGTVIYAFRKVKTN